MISNKLTRLSFNSLRVFHYLGQDCSTVKVATRLNMSQSAVSHVLKRLREDLDDPLFIKTRNGLLPTPYAERVLEELPELLDAFSDLLEGEQKFEPKMLNMEIVISIVPELLASKGDQLYQEVAKQAPGVTLQLRLPNSDTISQLERGETLVSVGSKLDYNLADITDLPLTKLKGRFYCNMREGHPLQSAELTPDVTKSYPHVVLNNLAYQRFHDNYARMLDGYFGEREIVLRSEHPMPLFKVVAETDALFVTLTKYPKQIGVSTRELPALNNFEHEIVMYTHQRNRKRPVVLWLQKIIASILTSG